MIKSLTVTNHLGDSLLLELRSPEKSGLLIQSIEGLGPSKANINSTELATMDGAHFNSARATPRNIVLTLALLEFPTIEDSRQRTYKYFPVKKDVTLRIETDNRTVETVGRVESNEPNIFSRQQTTQISILCPDPYFYAEGDSGTVFSGVLPKFSFPFCNNSLTENLLSFGDLRFDTRVVFEYAGDADTGMVITIHALGSSANITLFNSTTGESMKIDVSKISILTGQPYGLGEDIIISTIRGDRYVRLLRGGEYYNIIGVLNKDADWFQVSNGENIFAFVTEDGLNNIMVSFGYRNSYGGI